MVLDDTTRLNEVLHAWEEARVPGVTILESTGLARTLERHNARAAYAGFSQMFGVGRVGHNTLFAVINDIDRAEAVATRVEAILGNLNNPNTGIMFVVPVLATWGLDRGSEQPAAGEE
jgi:hypothetical protein